jgi:DnaK suppressor protein
MENHLSKEEILFFKNDLEEKRNKILVNLKNSSQEVNGCQSRTVRDESDYASFYQGINTYKSISEKQTQMLKEIEESLSKIKEETYGICEMCEEPIPLERLKVKVFARYCIHCREVVEKQEGL